MPRHTLKPDDITHGLVCTVLSGLHSCGHDDCRNPQCQVYHRLKGIPLQVTGASWPYVLVKILDGCEANTIIDTRLAELCRLAPEYLTAWKAIPDVPAETSQPQDKRDEGEGAGVCSGK